MNKNYSKLNNASSYYRDLVTSKLILPSPNLPENEKNFYTSILSSFLNSPSEEKALSYISKLDSGNFSITSEENIALKAAIKATLLFLSFHNTDERYSNKPTLEKHSQLISQLRSDCLKNSPGTAEYHYLFGLISIKLKSTSEAVSHIEKALQLKKEMYMANAVLGFIYTFEEEWNLALPHIRKAIEQNIDLNQQRIMSLCLASCTFMLGNERIEGASDYSLIRNNSPIDIDSYIKKLPEVNLAELDHSQHNKPIILAPSDDNYFLKHSLPLALSVNETCNNAALHLHIYNPKPESEAARIKLKQILKDKVSFSYESADPALYGGPGIYYSATRIVRMHQMLRLNKQKRISLIDADSLFRKDIESIAGINDGDWVLSLFESGNSPMWEKINGAFRTWRYSKPMAELTEKYIAYNISNILSGTHYWFSGQLVNSFLYEMYKDKANIVITDNELSYDLNHTDSSVIWGITNHKEASSRYNEYKNYLLNKYGFKP